MTSVRINMPQMAVRGLSENWLFKFCGDLHWQEVCRRHGVRSDELTDEAGRRVYTSFVAIRARYKRPLAHIAENDTLEFTTHLDRYGPALMRSRHSGAIRGAGAIELEMLTKFVVRSQEEKNELRQASVRATATGPIVELAMPPPLSLDFQAARKGSAPRIAAGIALQAFPSAQGEIVYDPNPFTDFNGAGLLYFASYPAIADHLERLILMRSADYRSFADRDWAVLASTVARDTYYFGNLDLGDAIRARLSKFERVGPSQAASSEHYHVVVSLEAAGSGRLLADIHALKAIAP